MLFERNRQDGRQLNVCVLTWSVYASDGRVRKYAESLAAEGASVDVICLSPQERPRIPHNYRLNSVNVFEVDRRKQEKTITSYIISLVRFWFISLWRVTLMAIRKKYDLVHVHSIPDFEVFAAFAAKLGGARVILDLHDPMPDFFAAKFKVPLSSLAERLLRIAERISISFSDHVITVTEHWRSIIVQRSDVPLSKISVIVNFPDLKLFDISRHPRGETKRDSFVLLYPGTLNKHCGLDIAVKAVNIVKQVIPSIRFDIYGKGSEAGTIRSLVKTLKIEDTVLFHDPVPWDEVPGLMAASDAGIALLSGTGSFSQHALNVKIFEFLAMGVPVVATRTCSTESFLDETNIAFSRPNDPADVARAIVEIFLNRQRRNQLIENGLQYTGRHNWNSEMGRYRQILANLSRFQSEEKKGEHHLQNFSRGRLIYKLYYLFKPIIPRVLQIRLRQKLCTKYRSTYAQIWPIDPGASEKPVGWNGWPEKKQFALVLTHDVESLSGSERCLDLMEMEMRLGFRSSFNFVAEDYPVNVEMFNTLRQNGFEIGVHGLHHDGKMYRSEKSFNDYARRINAYLARWQSVGFRSPAMRHNLKWIHALNIRYDASTFDTDPFEPQPNGIGTIFPFWVQNEHPVTGYIELPYTLPQDFTLFVLLKERCIDIWKRKLDWIAESGGMALLDAHPDFMVPTNASLKFQEYPMAYYRDFLEYVRKKYEGMYWNALPKDVASLWMQQYGSGGNRRNDKPGK